MATQTKYKTKQSEELIAYLQSVPGEHLTVQDICHYFQQHGTKIGTTTVYRQLERLVADGQVLKSFSDAGSSACFEYVGKKESCHQSSCFHCKCEKCGKLIHLQCDTLAKVQQHILQQHGFSFDTRRTVFYGLCESCQ